MLVKIHSPSWLLSGFAMFANGVYTNQSSEGEYGLRESRGEMRNLKKKLLSFQNPHSIMLLPLSGCFLSSLIFFFLIYINFYRALHHPLFIVTLSHSLGKPLFRDGIPQWRRPHVPYPELP